MDSERNIYKNDVDFKKLASQDADFAKYLKPNGQLDFSDPEAVQQLTKSLLKRDFDLTLTLPPDRLCPPVPNRLNYMLWIQDLVDSTSPSCTDRYDPNREVTGLDIGTGASCIYPLLGCAHRPKWKFVATDIDPLSITYAQKNISGNGLSSRIHLRKTTPDGPLIPMDALGLESLTFTLTNPPFYPTRAALLASAAAKSRPPNTACTGSASEMVTPGGEVGFASRIIRESLALGARVQWYTTLLGHLSSVSVVVEELKGMGAKNWAVTEFVQGQKTRRWGVGWSWLGWRPAVRAARGVGAGGGVGRGLLPFPGEFVVEMGGDVEGVGRRVDGVMKALPLRWKWRPELGQGVGFSSGDVWSRKARRKMGRGEGAEEGEGSSGRAAGGGDGDEDDEDEEDEMAFGFKIALTELLKEDGKDEGKAVKFVLRWLKGFNSAVFESFCGMVKRKLEGS